MDLVTTLTIILAVFSSTLSVVAILFAWVSYKNSVKMQMDAQAILTQVSQKVEVVVERTTHQIDRAWDYFTGSVSPHSEIEEVDISKKEDELKAKIIAEAKKEIAELMKQAGVERDVLNNLVSKVENLVGRTTDKTQAIVKQHQLLDKVGQIEGELRQFMENNLALHMPSEIPILEFMRELKKYFPMSIYRQLERVFETKNRLLQSDDVPLERVEDCLMQSNRLLDFIRMELRRPGKI